MRKGSLLSIRDLHTRFHTYDGVVRAVDGVSLDMSRGETLGLVGESGCGKSVTALSTLRLLSSPPAEIQGQILFEGVNLLDLSPEEMRKIRGNRISMVFQEPMTSLNPVLTIGDQVSENIVLHQRMSVKGAREKAIEMLKRVQIPSPEHRIYEYPHKLSGGMRQRVMIAMALSCNPQLLIADEPTTALDVTIQAQIVDLMIKIKEETGTSIILITHDLGLIAEMAQRVVVMYTGKVVEEADAIKIFQDPLHPYTRGLLQSIPWIGRKTKEGRRKLQEIPGIVPNLLELPPGCNFQPRCPEERRRCREEDPPLVEKSGGHWVRCWVY